LKNRGIEAFQSHNSSSNVEHVDISPARNTEQNLECSSVFGARELAVAGYQNRCPKLVVIFKPKWGFEEENDFGDLSGSVGSLQVIYFYEAGG